MSRKRKLAAAHCPEREQCRALRDVRERTLALARQLHELRDRLFVEERRREKAEEQLLTDPLTGASNRCGLEMKFCCERAKADRFGTDLYLVFLDVDGFGAFNKTHGQLTGDRILQEIVCSLRSCLRPYDGIFRIGGEEFAVVLPEVASAEDACAIAERLRRKVEGLRIEPHDGEEPLWVTISLGVAHYRAGQREGERLEELIDRANQAERAAKAAGKNSVFFYSAEGIVPAGSRMSEAVQAPG